jgi:thiamine biosynthesis lipoprotein
MSSAFLLSAVLASVPSEAPAQTWSFHLDHVLGTSFDMAIEARSRAEAEFAFAAATSEVARLDRVLSGWRHDSELSALNRIDEAQVSPDLFSVLSACEAWRERTGGAFSARLGDVERAWKQGATPDPATLCAAAARAAAADVRLDRAHRSVARDGVRFAPDALAKGYVIDAALAAARRAAPCASAILVDIGGDMACWGDRDWPIGVADPAQRADNAPPAELIRVANGALAVSGPGPRDRVLEGVAYSHLLDAATGQPAPRRQAAVLAPNAATADALATALAVMPRDQGLALAEATPGVEALILEDGDRWPTSGWSACQAAAPLPAGMGVEVTYTLPKIEAGNYRKPFVIVWVTDAAKNPVKTLLIMGKRAEWQEDNYVWWRRYGRKDPKQVEAMGQPTRAPGRYTVAWDGTDASGKRAPQGTYLIHIEAAREHGGHAYQTIEVKLGAAPVAGQAAAKDELGPSTARYGKSK